MVKLGPVFQARWGGECNECFMVFEEGDDVRFNECHEIICASCGEEIEDLE